MCYVALYAVDVLLVAVYLAVEDEQVVEALLYVGFVGAQSRLLFLYLFLNARALALQSANLGCRILCVVLLCASLLLCSGFLALRCLLFAAVVGFLAVVVFLR